MHTHPPTHTHACMHTQLVYVLHTAAADEVLSHSGHQNKNSHILVFGSLGGWVVGGVAADKLTLISFILVWVVLSRGFLSTISLVC